MYREHVPIIASGMRARLPVFKRGVMFAVLSARQPFDTVGYQLKDVATKGRDSPYLFAWKRDAFLWLEIHAADLAGKLATVRLNQPGTAVYEISRMPGLGVVKSAFVAQLMGWDVGCLDTRNVQRLGLNPRAYRSDGVRKLLPSFGRKVDRYIAKTGGQAERLWDDWCRDAAITYKMTPDAVSAEHLVIVPRGLRVKLAPFILPHVKEEVDNGAPF